MELVFVPDVFTYVSSPFDRGAGLVSLGALNAGGDSAIAESNLVGPEGGQSLADRTVDLINSLWPGQ
jgi:hypothetical protein